MNLWEVRVADGSSTTLVREALNKENPENKTGTINFIATESLIVYLHHHQWHEALRKDHGLDDDEIWAEGKIVFLKDELPHPRIAIQCKGRGFSGESYVKSQQMEEAIDRFLWDLILGLRSWGESFNQALGHSPDTNCPHCYWQLNGIGLPQGIFTFIVGFTTDGPVSGRGGIAGIFIVECQKCFEKYWFHAGAGHIETCKRVGRWPNEQD